MNRIAPIAPVDFRTPPFHNKPAADLYLPRIARLAFLLTEIGKRYDQRAPEMADVLGPETRFDLSFVTVGRRLDSGILYVDRCDMIGLAALDPFFQEQGLEPSLIMVPGRYDSLDIGGVLLRSSVSGKKVRVSWRDTELCDFFGLGVADWRLLNDAEAYWNRYKSRVVITPDMLLDTLNSAVLKRFKLSLAEVCRVGRKAA